MALAFDRIGKLLGDNQNVFGLTGGAPSSGLGSSSAGDISSAPSGGSAPVPQNQQTTNAAQKSVIAKNAGRVKSPVDTAVLTGQIDGAKTGIQNEANAYVSGSQTPYKEATAPTADQVKNWGFTGNAGQAYTNQPQVGLTTPESAQPVGSYSQYSASGQAPMTKSWYDLATQAPVAPDPLKFKTNTDMKDIGLIGNDIGIRELFRRQGDAEYTSGMSGLDSQLLRGSGQFQKDASDVLSSYGDLQKTKGEIGDKAQGAARAAALAAQKEYRDKIGLAATSAITSLNDDQEVELKNQPGIAKDFTGDMDSIKQSIISADPGLAALVGGINSEDFKKLIRESTNPGVAGSQDWSDYIDQNEAGAYNKIFGLLGTGESRVAGNKGGKKADLDLQKLIQAMKARGVDKPISPLPPPPVNIQQPTIGPWGGIFDTSKPGTSTVQIPANQAPVPAIGPDRGIFTGMAAPAPAPAPAPAKPSPLAQQFMPTMPKLSSWPKTKSIFKF